MIGERERERELREDMIDRLTSRPHFASSSSLDQLRESSGEGGGLFGRGSWSGLS